MFKSKSQKVREFFAVDVPPGISPEREDELDEALKDLKQRRDCDFLVLYDGISIRRID